jgi:hypothetical protein
MSSHKTQNTQSRRNCAWAYVVSLLLGCVAAPCWAQTGTQHEYELKAAFLYRIIGYVEWPSGALSNNPPAIQIGLVGHIPFADTLEVILKGKTIQGRELVVKHISDPHDAAGCQVLFISASEKPRISEIVDEVKDRPVLTVGEVQGFAEQGGMVNLLAGPSHIVIEINREVASRAKLGMSSDLLKVAKIFPR